MTTKNVESQKACPNTKVPIILLYYVAVIQSEE